MKTTLSALLDRLGNHSKGELQALCQHRGLSIKGTRDELISRLVEVRREEPRKDPLVYEPPPH